MRVAPRCLFERPLTRVWLADGFLLGTGWHTAHDPMWSRDRVATVLVDAARFPEPVPLVLSLRVFGASAEEPRTLLLDSPGTPEAEITVTTPRTVRVRMFTPHHAPGAAHTPVTLTLDRLTSPVQQGLSQDDRLLGLMVERIDPPVVSLDTPLDLTVAGTFVAPLTAAGWAPPEPGTGMWMLGGASALVLPGYLRPEAGKVLILDAAALPRGADQPPIGVGGGVFHLSAGRGSLRPHRNRAGQLGHWRRDRSRAAARPRPVRHCRLTTSV